MIRKATDIFSEWASIGKDKGMQRNHWNAVKKMFQILNKEQSKPFSFIDAGCGNGWVIRKVNMYDSCYYSVGVDGSKNMIEAAHVTRLAIGVSISLSLITTFVIVFFAENFIGIFGLDPVAQELAVTYLTISILFIPTLLFPKKGVQFGGRLMGIWTGICLKLFLGVNILVIGVEKIP